MSLVVCLTRLDFDMCPSGLKRFDLLAQGRGVCTFAWTSLHQVWLSCVYPSFARWLREQGLVPDVSLATIDLCRADFREAYFEGTHCEGARFVEARLSGVNFTRAQLRQVSFVRASLRWGNFWNADLTDADFSDADLTGANFSGAYLRGATFRRANLLGVDFYAADLLGADFTGANCEEAHFDQEGRADRVHRLRDEERGVR